ARIDLKIRARLRTRPRAAQTRFRWLRPPLGDGLSLDLEKDAHGGLRRAALPQEVHRKMKIDVGALREVARRLALVPDPLELLLTPEEDSLGFFVEFFEFEFRSR